MSKDSNINTTTFPTSPSLIEGQEKESVLLCFDADDTLWDNQSHYDSVEDQWFEVMKPYGTTQYLHDELYKVEKKNMPTMGYGTKAFCLSLIETALKLSNQTIPGTELQKIYDFSTWLLSMPATPFDGVAETLRELTGDYTLVCLTKGDLLDQENKLVRSGLMPLFSHVEIVSEKTESTYTGLCHRFGTTTDRLVMVGNSFKSDIDPVLRIGGYGLHIPFKRMWAYEHVEEYEHPRLLTLESITEVPDALNRIINQSRNKQ